MDNIVETATPSILEDICMGAASILDEMPGGFFIYNAEGNEELIYANSACLRIFGCETLEQFKQLTGFTFPGMVHDDDIDEIEQSIADQIAHDKNHMDYVEYRINTFDGSVRWIEDYGHYVTTDSGNYFYVFIDDATDRLHERMRELERVNKELNKAYERERENKETLRRALNQANAANAAKTAFLNSMSHNIRTLLNAVMGYSSMILEHATQPSKVCEYADHVLEASTQLVDVVSETLEVSRLESGDIQLTEEECIFADAVAGVIPTFEARAEEEGKRFDVKLRFGERLPVLVDLHYMLQLIVQLLDNAFKYTVKGDSVEVTVEEVADKTAGRAQIRLRISDTGIGMNEHFMARIFEPFEREGTTTDTGIIGTGLGLTIVKYVVDLMAGSIEVDSREGEGTTFEIVLAVKLASDAVQKTSEVRQPAQNRSVLVAEDNELNREIITCLLQDRGHVVVAVNDGQQAVDAIRASMPGDFDVVLMDIQMPVLNGYDATVKIRNMANPELANIPIIAVTSDAFPEDRKHAFSCGMDEHISKPLNIEALNTAIERVIASKSPAAVPLSSADAG